MGYKQYCKNYQDIENYGKAKKDNFKGWECHHRLETHTPDGKRRLVDISKKELIALDMYYDRPANELIFLTVKEHYIYRKGRPGTNKGKHLSAETKKKMSEAKEGENNPNYGRHHSEETKKKMAESWKGKRWYNNGKINIRARECPQGFVPGRLKRKFR